MKQIDVKMTNNFILYECVINFEFFFYFSIFFLRCSINRESILTFNRKIENFNLIIHFHYLHTSRPESFFKKNFEAFRIRARSDKIAESRH